MNDVIISLDLKKNRIRFHKETLHRLGNPNYIQLLFNPDTKTIAFKCLDKSEPMSFKLSTATVGPDNSVELYSSCFLARIQDVFSELDSNVTYRLTGSIVESERLAFFPLNTLLRVDHSEV